MLREQKGGRLFRAAQAPRYFQLRPDESPNEFRSRIDVDAPLRSGAGWPENHRGHGRRLRAPSQPAYCQPRTRGCTTKLAPARKSKSAGAKGLLRRRSCECVHKADRHSVLVIDRGIWRERNPACPIRKHIVVGHIATVFQAANDVARECTLECSSPLAHVLPEWEACGKSRVIYEVLAASGECPFSIGSILDVAGNTAPPNRRSSGHSFVRI